MFHRFVRRFEYNDEKLGKVTYPRGWAGELEDDVAELAKAENALFIDKAASVPKSRSGKPSDPDDPDMTAAKTKVEDLRAKIKSASGDDKDTAVAELKVALADLNKLKKA